jgi:predicted RNA-binding protein with PUA-like domain
MRYFLAKTDPETYSLQQLAREGRTVWDGVRNPQALRAIREMRPGDRVFIYHSQPQAAVVGWATVDSEPRADPKDARLTVVDLAYGGALEPPATLAEIKGSGKFGDWSLVRQGRLSTMAAPDSFVCWMQKRYPGVRI